MSCTGGGQYFRNSSKGEQLYPFCCSASYIKILLFTASRGLCCDSFTVFLHSVFKVMPWEQNFSFKIWISKCSKIHRHLQHVSKIVIPHQSQGQLCPCRSEVSWFNRSSDNTSSFNLSRRTAFNMLLNPLGYDDGLKNSAMTMIAGQFTVQIWGHSPSPAYLQQFLILYFFMNSS